MSAGWEIGDLAVCVDWGRRMCPSNNGGIHTGKRCPSDGRARKVAWLGHSPFVGGHLHGQTCPCLDLHFEDGSLAASWRCRKILPDKHEACETEFVTLLNRIKQPVEAERSALFMGGK